MRSGVELRGDDAARPHDARPSSPACSVGQVIELEGDAQSQAKLSARQKTLFVCEFGKLGQNYTVRIRHPFDAGQDFIDGLVPAVRRQRREIGEHR